MNMKNRIAKSVTSGMLVLSLGTASVGFCADEYRGDLGVGNDDPSADMLFDLVVVRPLGLVAYVAGVGAWVVSLPFSIPSESVVPVANELVGKPIEYTFSRPLGTWHQCGDDKHPC